MAGHEVFRVEKFTEKPALARGAPLRRLGKVSLERRHVHLAGCDAARELPALPAEMAGLVKQIADAGGIRSSAFPRLYPKFEKISIDFALMEKISDIYAVPRTSDGTTWEAGRWRTS